MERFIYEVPEFKLIFPAIFKPLTFPGTETKKYSCGMAFSADAPLARLQDGLAKTARDKFGSKWTEQGVRRPWQYGHALTDKLPTLKDHVLIRASSNWRPVVRDTTGPRLIVPEPKRMTSGVRCTAEVEMFAYASYGHKGVAMALLSITKTAEGDFGEAFAEMLALDGLEYL